MPNIVNSSGWLRANTSGFVSQKIRLGDQVIKGDSLAEIGSPYGDVIGTVKATRSGILIGIQHIPLVQEGEAIFHIAYFTEDDDAIAEHIETIQEQLLPDYNN